MLRVLAVSEDESTPVIQTDVFRGTAEAMVSTRSGLWNCSGLPSAITPKVRARAHGTRTAPLFPSLPSFLTDVVLF